MIEEFTLECIRGRRRGQRFTFPGCGSFVVGRRRGCDVSVPDDDVSGRHCLLQADGRDLWLRDTGSTNGTRVGERRVEETLLRDGDVVTLGQSCALRVHIRQGVSPQAEALIEDIAKTVALGPAPSPEPEELCRCELCGKRFPARERTEGLNICPNCMDNEPEAVLRFLLADVPPKAEDPKGGPPKLEGLRCLRKLGEGAFGAVWLMEDAAGRKLALKTMLESAMAQEVERKKFSREMSIAAQLRHQNIVALYGSGQRDGAFYLLQEYCPCGSLVQVIERNYLRWGGRMPINLAVHITLQVLDALEYAHSAQVEAEDAAGHTQRLHGVVHRDIHPGNLFVMDNSDHPLVKVGDWGLSKAYELAGLSGVSAGSVPTGTMDFAPMQQHLNFRYSGPEVDVWATAAVFYYLLTGQPPRGPGTGGDPFPPVRDVRRLRPEVPEKLAHALNQTLREKPRLQVLTAAELRELIWN